MDQRITIKNQNMSLCSKQSILFSFYALSSGGKSKGTIVHFLCKIWKHLQTNMHFKFVHISDIKNKKFSFQKR